MVAYAIRKDENIISEDVFITLSKVVTDRDFENEILVYNYASPYEIADTFIYRTLDVFLEDLLRAKFNAELCIGVFEIYVTNDTETNVNEDSVKIVETIDFLTDELDKIKDVLGVEFNGVRYDGCEVTNSRYESCKDCADAPCCPGSGSQFCSNLDK